MLSASPVIRINPANPQIRTKSLLSFADNNGCSGYARIVPSPRLEGLPMKTGLPAYKVGPVGFTIDLALALFLGLASVRFAQAQPSTLPPPSPLPAQTAKPVDITEIHFPSQVFPDGGFPPTRHAPEGGIPSSSDHPQSKGVSPQLQPSDSEYPAPGFYAKEVQEGPSVPEFFHPIYAPLPDYFYLPD